MNARSRTRRIGVILAGLLLAGGIVAIAQDAAGTSSPTIVIDEVELNPEGFDTDNEWVELLNVGSETIDLAGWSLSTSYRTAGTVVISEESKRLAPGARYVFVYPGLRLRNAADLPIQLFDADGNLVDETPALADTDDDENTWQRFPNEGDVPIDELWWFLPATRNKPNTA